MFCDKCGYKLCDGAVFCNNCGARINAVAPASAPTPNMVPNAYESYSKKVFEGQFFSRITAFTGLGGLQYLLTLSAMLLSSILLLFFLDIKVEAMWVSVGARTQGAGFYIVTGILCLCATIVAALPIIMRKKAGKLYFLPAKIVFIAVFVLIVIYHIALVGESGEYSGLASVKMNFAGWMFYIFSVCSVVMSFILTHCISKGIPNGKLSVNHYNSGSVAYNPNPKYNYNSTPNPAMYTYPVQPQAPQSGTAYAPPAQPVYPQAPQPGTAYAPPAQPVYPQASQSGTAYAPPAQPQAPQPNKTYEQPVQQQVYQPNYYQPQNNEHSDTQSGYFNAPNNLN